MTVRHEIIFVDTKGNSFEEKEACQVRNSLTEAGNVGEKLEVYGVNLYAIALLVSIVLLMMLLIVGHRQNITYYILVFMTITISIMGYYSISCTTSLETAVLGNRLTYIGAVFIPILMLLCFYKLCKLRFSRILISVLTLWGTIVLFFAFSIEHRTVYYKKVWLVHENGVSYLEKEYGPMHVVFIAFLGVCFLSSLGVAIYSYFMKKRVSYKVTLCLLLCEIFTLSFYFFKDSISESFDLVPISYIINEIIVLVLIRRINMYEISENIASILEKQSNYGYLVFDNNMKYIGCNEVAPIYMKEIKKLKVDKTLTSEETPFLYDCFFECMKEEISSEHTHEHMIEKDGRYLKCDIKNLLYGRSNKKVGFLIEIVDDTQQQKYLKLINNYNTDLEKEVEKKTQRINQLQEKLVLGMAEMIGSRDNSTGGHIRRTSKVIRIFAKYLKKYDKEYDFEDGFLESIIKAAPMHDLGKIAVDDRILRKPGKFTPEEFEEMKKHSEKGAEIVEQLLEGIDDEQFARITKNIAHYHHEKWNGQGYPCGLAGEEIPIEARIMALADVFDALVSKRCYKEKMDYDKAFSIIEESAGSHFDPKLTKVFFECRDELCSFYDNEEDD